MEAYKCNKCSKLWYWLRGPCPCGQGTIEPRQAQGFEALSNEEINSIVIFQNMIREEIA